jgi:flagella basal body P-ring formation protein FlgA
MMPRAFHSLIVAAAAGLALLTGAAVSFAGETVTIPNRVIYPGETIPAEALKEVTLSQGKQPPAAVAMARTDIEGKIARRTLLPGRYIPLAAVRDAFLVEQGAAVQVLFVSGVLTISAAAVTLQPGSAGDMIKVRNLDSGKVLSGTIMADGSVRVSGL